MKSSPVRPYRSMVIWQGCRRTPTSRAISSSSVMLATLCCWASFLIIMVPMPPKCTLPSFRWSVPPRSTSDSAFCIQFLPVIRLLLRWSTRSPQNVKNTSTSRPEAAPVVARIMVGQTRSRSLLQQIIASRLGWSCSAAASVVSMARVSLSLNSGLVAVRLLRHRQVMRSGNPTAGSVSTAVAADVAFGNEGPVTREGGRAVQQVLTFVGQRGGPDPGHPAGPVRVAVGDRDVGRERGLVDFQQLGHERGRERPHPLRALDHRQRPPARVAAAGLLPADLDHPAAHGLGHVGHAQHGGFVLQPHPDVHLHVVQEVLRYDAPVPEQVSHSPYPPHSIPWSSRNRR